MLHRLVRGGVGLIALLCLASGAGWAEQEWSVYTDPSVLRSISRGEDHVWAAGRGGLVRFRPDDSDIAYFTRAEGLPQEDLNVVLAKSDEEVWIGSSGAGLARYRPAEADPWFLFKTFPHALASNTIYSLMLGGDGRLWYGTDAGFGVFEGDLPGEVWTRLNGLGNESVHSLAFGADTLFVGTGGGIFRLLPDGALLPEAGAPLGLIENIVLAADSLWALSAGNIWRRALAGGGWQALAKPIAGYGASAIAAQGDALAIALDEPSGDSPQRQDRVYRYLPDQGTWIDLSADLPNVTYPAYGNLDYQTLCYVADDELWLGGSIEGGFGPGLLHFDGAGWTQHPFADRPLGSEINVVRRGPAGETWCMSLVGGARLSGETWTRYPSDLAFAGLPRFSLDMLADSEGWVWLNRFARSFGRMIPDTEERELIAVGDNSISTTKFVVMAEDSAGRRWFCSDDAGIDIFDVDETWHNINATVTGLPDNGVHGIAFLDTQRAALLVRGEGLVIWIHGGDPSAGAGVWNSSIVDELGYLSTDTQFSCLALGSGGQLWVGQPDGLILLLPEGATYRTHARLQQKTLLGEGLLSQAVNDIAASPDGSIWVGTLLGLSQVRFDEESGWSVANWTNEAGREEAGTQVFPPEVLVPLPHQSVLRTAVDAAGETVFLGTQAGAARLRILPDPPPPTDQVASGYLYPNPARFNQGHRGVRLGGVAGPVDVSVYNLEGQLVADSGRVEPGGVAWDFKTRFGNWAVSGVYYLRIVDRGQVVVKTLVLER